MVVDRKTGNEVQVLSTLVRKDYKGFKHQYEVLGFLPKGLVWVRKLTQGDRWVYLTMTMKALQLDEVLL
jgi:hypothetical protein